MSCGPRTLRFDDEPTKTEGQSAHLVSSLIVGGFDDVAAVVQEIAVRPAETRNIGGDEFADADAMEAGMRLVRITVLAYQRPICCDPHAMERVVVARLVLTSEAVTSAAMSALAATGTAVFDQIAH